MKIYNMTLTQLLLTICFILPATVHAGEKMDLDRQLLYTAKSEGYMELIKLHTLIKNGADITAADSDGMTAIHLAAKYNSDPKVIELPAASGADINAVTLNNETTTNSPLAGTPLYYALCYNPNFKVIETLLKLHTQAAEYPIYALVTLAARNPNAEIIDNMYKLLLNELLLKSALNTNPDIIENFINLGADVNATYPGKPITPIYIAVKANNFSGTQILLEKGADTTISARYDDNKTLLLISASNNVELNTGKIIRCLLAWGASINDTDSNGNSALHLAVRQATEMYKGEYQAYPLNVIEEIIEQGADIHLKNFAGETPLEFAKQHLQTSSGSQNLSKQAIQILEQAEIDMNRNKQQPHG